MLRIGSELQALEADRLLCGKMLRTQLAGRLGEASQAQSWSAIEAVCAATEIVHTASLCHDDVIDNAFVRRAYPTLWRRTNSTAAVLVGDLLLCEAMSLVIEADGGRYVRAFCDKVREVCMAEARQELCLRGTPQDEATCLAVARGKSGPLFALAAGVCGGDDDVLSAALEEAGYRIGTAYQLADDLLDVLGDESVARKTLRTDGRRGKFTLAHLYDDDGSRLRGHIRRLCGGAVDCLSAWPEVRAGLERFLASDLQPVLGRYDGQLDVLVSEGA